MKVLITGATGFVGIKLCQEMLAKGAEVFGIVRSLELARKLPKEVKPISLDTIDGNTNWSGILEGIDVVFHLAARVHIKKETALDPLKEFRLVNTLGTMHLAKAAASAGVKRFVFMSTIGVNGKGSGKNPYNENDIPSPHNMYSISKWEAEKELEELGRQSAMTVISVRSPLLYGAGDPGNFHTLVKVVDLGIPLPVAAVKNSKSFLYVGNLVNALWVCATHPSAKGIYIVSDCEDIPTSELINRLANELNQTARMFSFPLFLTRLAALCIGKQHSIDQLVSTLVVDSSKIQRELNWKPPFSMQEGLRETIKWYKERA